MSNIFVSKESVHQYIVRDKQTFFAIEAELPDDVSAALLEWQKNYRDVQLYLSTLESLLNGRNNPDLSTVEVPVCLGTAAAPSAEPPKKKGIAQRLSSK